MSLNRKVTDLIIHKMHISKKSGSRWVRPTNGNLELGQKYKLTVTFGNKDGKISWKYDQYRKDNCHFQFTAMGFKKGKEYYHRDKIIFYTSDTYRTKVVGFLGKYRNFFFVEKFPTTSGNMRKDFYFEVSAGGGQAGTITYPISTFRWECGIDASVRDFHTHEIYSTI